MNNRICNFNVICVCIAEFAPRSRLHQPEVHAGNHPGPGHCHGLQVRLSKVCLGREWWVNKTSATSVNSSDMMMMYWIFFVSPRQCHFHVCPLCVDSSPQRRRHRERWVCAFEGDKRLSFTVKEINFPPFLH